MSSWGSLETQADSATVVHAAEQTAEHGIKNIEAGCHVYAENINEHSCLLPSGSSFSTSAINVWAFIDGSTFSFF